MLGKASRWFYRCMWQLVFVFGVVCAVVEAADRRYSAAVSTVAFCYIVSTLALVNRELKRQLAERDGQVRQIAMAARDEEAQQRAVQRAAERRRAQ